MIFRKFLLKIQCQIEKGIGYGGYVRQNEWKVSYCPVTKFHNHVRGTSTLFINTPDLSFAIIKDLMIRHKCSSSCHTH